MGASSHDFHGEIIVPIACLRLWLLLASLVASLQVGAEQRFWTLTGVQFDDGAIATGTIAVDDVTRAVVTWNVRVGGGKRFYAYTYTPGNSSSHTGTTYEKNPYVWFESDLGYAWWYERHLSIETLLPLDGSNATVPIVITQALVHSREGAGAAWGFERYVIAGTLTLAAPPPPAAIVQVDEFHHPASGHYFMTADAREKDDLDAGVHPGWMRTGQSFKAYATESIANGPINPVCRHYRDPSHGPVTHFYSADASECASVIDAPDWLYESDDVFQIALPDKATGACPEGTVPVYRLWNARADSNHRYTTSVEIKEQMLMADYVAEGYGPDAVAMCALAS